MSQPKETSKEKAAGEEPLIMPLEVVEGLHIPHVFRSCNRPLAEHVQLLKALEMREDDVLVLTYPKSGTHLTWEITSMLLAGKAEYEKRSKVFAMLEATPIEDLESAASPRVLNSHLLPRLLPRQIAAKKVKVIHAYRNVKDAFVSAFFHYRQIPGAEDLTMEKLEKPFFSGKVPMGDYVTYMKDMDDFKKNPDVPVFTVSFEDMKDDPEKAVRNLAEFLGVEASAQLCADIAAATSFSKMKEADRTIKKQPNMPFTDYYRKGEVGDWKNYLTVTQSERFEAHMTQLKSCDYRFRYTL